MTADIGNDSTVDVTYKWDALGRRVYRDDGTTALVYVQSGQQTIADYTAGTAASSPKYRYVYASYIDEPVLRYEPGTSASRYYHRNQQYSITALTDGAGAIAERYAYSAYGELTVLDGSGTVTTTDNRYTYTGREWDDELELYHYRARMYDPVAGRFLGRDPIGFDGSPWNVYEFVLSGPLNSVDPSGKARWSRTQIVCELSDSASGLWVNDYPVACYIYCLFSCYMIRQDAVGDNQRPRRAFPPRTDDLGILPVAGVPKFEVDIEHCGSCSPHPPTPRDFCPPVKATQMTQWFLIEPDLPVA